MAETRTPIISFKDFSFQYRAQKQPTLHDINLDIYPGERVLIAGPSGSGKSTLAACINGLNPFSYPGECTGTLTVDGVDAPHSSIFELAGHVGTVLQDPDGQFIGLTVGEDIAFALENSCTPQDEMHEITRRAGRHREPPRLRSARAFRRPEAARQPRGRHGRRGEDFTVR